MKKSYRLLKKITNLFGIVFIMLGMIPLPVIGQVGSVYAAEQAEDGAAAIDLPAFVSYTELLGSTSVELDAVEMVVGLPDISGVHGDWISLAILGPVLLDEGDDIVPTEEPPADEAPAEEPPADEAPAEESPADEAPAEETPAEDGEEAPPDEAPAEETPAAEETPTEEDLCSDVDTDADGIVDCEDACPLDALNECQALLEEEEPACEGECVPEAVEEPAAEEVDIAEIVVAVAENDLVLVDDSGEPLDMASQETTDLLSEVVDPWFDAGGGDFYGFSSTGTCVDFVPVANCFTFEANPIQAAINHPLAVSGTTIYILPDVSYSTMEVDVTKDVTLEGVVGDTSSHSPSPTPVTIGTVNLYVDISDWANVFASIVNVMNDTAEIQDGIDLVASGGVVNVSEGTYILEDVSNNKKPLTINKPLTLNGAVGSPTAYGPGKGAPILMQSMNDWQTSAAIELGADSVTIQGFIFKGFEYGVDINSHNFVNINNNMFLYYPTSGGGIYIDGGTPLVEEYNIEFPPEENGYGKFYNNECSNPLYDCTKVEDEKDGGIYWITADVVVIKTGKKNGHEFFFTPDNSTPCDPATELYCVTWNYNGSITIVRGLGQDISHVQFWNFTNIEPKCGDGILDPGEQCDDGNNVDDDGCSANCTLESNDPACGDNYWDEETEECDPTGDPTGAPDGVTCNTDCTLPDCGDGYLDTDAGETCDPGIKPGTTGYAANCRTDTCTYCGDNILQDPPEKCEPKLQDHCSDTCEFEQWCGDGIVQKENGETCDPEAPGAPEDCDPETCTYCGDGIVQKENGETCDPGDPEQDYCDKNCKYKKFKAFTLDPHCVGVFTLGWFVSNPNPYSVPNTHVVVDGAVRFDGTFPANTTLSMGTTADGPATHTMSVSWPDGGYAEVSSNELCKPRYIPPPSTPPGIAVTGETFIIPVTGADLVSALATKQGMFFSIGAALLGLSLMIGGTKKKK